MAGQECRDIDGVRHCRQGDGTWLPVRRTQATTAGSAGGVSLGGFLGIAGAPSSGSGGAGGGGSLWDSWFGAGAAGATSGTIREGIRVAGYFGIAAIVLGLALVLGILAYFASPIIAALK